MTFIRCSTQALLLAVLVASTSGAQSARPIVRVIGTGGTIGSAGDYWAGKGTHIPIEELLRVPGIDSVATLEAEQAMNVASTAIGPPVWLQLSHRVSILFRERPDLSGVVITHGTDTMEETSYFLDLTVGGDRPVIVTGAMRPSTMAGADGPANLTNAIRAASSSSSRARGTMVLMDDRLYAARNVTKTSTTRVEAFQAPEHGPLALVDPEGVFFRNKPDRGVLPQFDVTGLTALPRVDIAYVYGGADGAEIGGFLDAGARGIVVAGAGRGSVPAAQQRVLRAAASRGIIVVISSRTGSGRVPSSVSDYAIGAGDLNPQKARVLLSLALSRTSDIARLRKIFEENQ